MEIPGGRFFTASSKYAFTFFDIFTMFICGPLMTWIRIVRCPLTVARRLTSSNPSMTFAMSETRTMAPFGICLTMMFSNSAWVSACERVRSWTLPPSLRTLPAEMLTDVPATASATSDRLTP